MTRGLIAKSASLEETYLLMDTHWSFCAVSGTFPCSEPLCTDFTRNRDAHPRPALVVCVSLPIHAIPERMSDTFC